LALLTPDGLPIGWLLLGSGLLPEAKEEELEGRMNRSPFGLQGPSLTGWEL